MTQQQKKRISLLLMLAALVFVGVVAWFVGRPMVRFVSDPPLFRQWVESHGIWSRLAFLGMVIFQVLIAFIPGEPLEIGAGYAFGALEGTLLCMVGITIGSVMVFQLVRRLGVKFVELFFSMEKIHSMKFLQNERRLDTVAFLIFLIPGTPKDLLSYLAGLTPLRLSTWIFISLVARIPSIVTSTIGGSALSTENYVAAGIVFAATAVVSLVGLLIYNAWSRHRQEKTGKNASRQRP